MLILCSKNSESSWTA